MSPRAARTLAWSLWAVGTASVVAAGIVSAAYPFTSSQETQDPFGEFIWACSWLGFGLVGALIVSRRPNTRIAWALLGITFATGLGVLGPGYGRAADAGVGLPLGELGTWIATWAVDIAFGLVVAVLLLFPSDGLATRRQRLLGRALLTVIVGMAVIRSITPGPVEGDVPPFNPLGVTALEQQLRLAGDILSMCLGAVAMLVLVDFVSRFWRSRGVQRLQFRWMVLAAAAFPILFAAAVAVEDAFLGPDQFDPVVPVFFVCGNGLAVAIGIAVTRHGLYEINRVVSRTISYLLLTVLLVGVYLAGVTMITTLTTPVIGDSPLAVAAATLAAAAAFGPARRRIQAGVDRRFNRSRYDAIRTVEEYRGLLREEVNLSALAADLVDTVEASMQPTATALWLAGGPAAEKSSQSRSAVTVPERHRETRRLL